MPVYDDDNDFRGGQDPRRARWETEGRPREFQEIVPDDLNTVECTECGKWIFEIFPRCPYCKCYQRPELRRHRPLWFWLAVAACMVFLTSSVVLTVLLLLGWH